MRKINKIIIHCTATPEGRDVTVNDLYQWHVKENGWSDIGYHFFIDLDGEIHECRPIERTGAHTKGQNYGSIGIAYAGGMDENMKPKDTRNQFQIDSLDFLLADLKDLYPKIIIYGHNNFSNKACPSFDARNEYDWLSNTI